MRKLFGAVLTLLLFSGILFTVSCNMGTSSDSSDDDSSSSSEETFLTATLELQNLSSVTTTDDDGTESTESDTGHWGVFAWVVDEYGDYVDTLEYYVDYSSYGDSSSAASVWQADEGDDLDGVTSATIEVDAEDMDTTDPTVVSYEITWDGNNAYGVSCDEGTYTIKLIIGRHTHDTPYYTEFEAEMTLGGDDSTTGEFSLVLDDYDDTDTYTDTTTFPYDVLYSSSLVYTPVTDGQDSIDVTYTISASSDILMGDADVASVVYTLTSDGETIASFSATEGSDSWTGSETVTITEDLLVDVYAAAYDGNGTIIHDCSESRFDAEGESTASLVMYLEPVVSDSDYSTYDITNGDGDSVTVTALYVDGSTIYAGTESDGLALSTDSGSSWTFTDTTTSGFNSNSVAALAVDGSSIYVGLAEDEDGNYGGLSLSTDSGSTYTYYDFGYEETEETTDDDGTTTSTTYSAGPDVSAILITDDYWYVGSDNGLAVSDDDGATWTLHDEDDANMPYSSGKSGDMYNVYTLYIDSDDLLWMGCWDGLYTSSDQGVTWTEDSDLADVSEFCYVGEVNGYTVAASWFGDDSSGLYFHDGSSWTNYVSEEDGLVSVRNFTVYYYNDIWYAVSIDDGMADDTGISLSLSGLDVWGEPSWDESSFQCSTLDGGTLWLGTETGLIALDLF
ncbi:MAG: hypothetical protein PQJ60_03515 [Spirochaetales bacterium]|nr:hypothetical protein [Spirochaetales bacterium]